MNKKIILIAAILVAVLVTPGIVRAATITVSQDKTTFNPNIGETVTLTLTVNYDTSTKEISEKVFQSDGTLVSNYGIVNSNTPLGWDGRGDSGSIVKDGQYTIHIYAWAYGQYGSPGVKPLDDVPITVTVSSSTSPMPSGGNQLLLTVISDKPSYAPGETATITFQVASDNFIQYGATIKNIAIIDPDGLVYQLTTTCKTAQPDGKCSITYTTDRSKTGTYNIKADASMDGFNDVTNFQTFTVSATPATPSATPSTGAGQTPTINILSCPDRCNNQYGQSNVVSGGCEDRGPLTENKVSLGTAGCTTNGQICMCQLQPKACSQACEDRGAVSGNCIDVRPRDQGDVGTGNSNLYLKCLQCVPTTETTYQTHYNIWCEDTALGVGEGQCLSVPTSGVQPFCAGRVARNRQDCYQYYGSSSYGYPSGTNVPYYTFQQLLDPSLMYRLSSGPPNCPYGNQDCYCYRTPFGSQNAYALVLDKSCVKGASYNFVNALIVWGGSQAQYASITFAGSYAYTGTGSISGGISSYLPSIYSPGLGGVGGSCNAMGPTSPFSFGSYNVPSSQEPLYALQHIVPCTTQVSGTGDTVRGYVNLFDANRMQIQQIPFDIDCKNAAKIQLPQPAENPTPQAGYPSAKILKIKCNNDLDDNWNTVDFDTSTGLTTSASGYCEMSFQNMQSFNAVELIASSDVNITRILVDNQPMNVNKQAKADTTFRYDFLPKTGRLLRIEYGTGSSGGTGTVCTTQYDPVCGDDGKTYTNDCEATKAGAGVSCKGVCPCPSSVERKYLCRYEKNNIVRFYCYRSSKCDDPFRTATLEHTSDNEKECVATCLQLQQTNSTLMGCDEVVPTLTTTSTPSTPVATGAITGKVAGTSGIEIATGVDPGVKSVLEISKEISGGSKTSSSSSSGTVAGKITFKEINPFPDSMQITTNLAPQVTLQNSPIVLTGYVRKKVSTDIGQRVVCDANYITGPYPEGCEASVDYGFLINKHVVSDCKPGPAKGYQQVEKNCQTPSGAIMALQSIQAIYQAYNIYECAQNPSKEGCPQKKCITDADCVNTYGSGWSCNKAAGICYLPSQTGGGTGSGSCSFNIPCITNSDCVNRCGSGYSCNIATGVCLLSSTGGVVAKGLPLISSQGAEQQTELKISTGTSGEGVTGQITASTGNMYVDIALALMQLFASEDAQKAQARLGSCRYTRDFRTQCLAGGEARCPQGDPKYPKLLSTPYESVDTQNPRASVVITVPIDYDSCTYFAPTKPAMPVQTSVKITLMKGHVRPPEQVGDVVWVRDVPTDEKGTFTYQLTAPEPGNYTIFMEAFGSYGSAYSNFDVIAPENPVIDVSPPSQCGTGDILYTVTVRSPTERSDIGSLITYDLSFQKPGDFDAGFVLPSGALADTYVMNIPIGQSASVSFSAKPKRILAENNYQFTINSDDAQHGLHGEASVNYFYTKRQPPTITFDPQKITVEAGKNGKFYADIKNNDPAQCSAALFYFSKEIPAGWAAVFSVGGTEVKNMLIDSQATVQGIFEVQSPTSGKKQNNVSIAISRDTPQDFLKVTGVKALAKDDAYIYFTTSNAIKRVPKLGGTAITVIDNATPIGIAVDPADTGLIYWAENGIKAADKNGVGEKTIADGYATQIAMDSSYIYYADRNSIKRVSKSENAKDCSGSNCVLIGNLSDVNDIAVDDSNNFIYWVDSAGIKRSNKDGSDVKELLHDSNIRGVAAGSIFYSVSNPGKIIRCDIFAANCETVTTSLAGPGELLTDENDLYWVESSAIKTINKDAITVYGSALYEVKPPPYPLIIIQPAVQTGPAGKEKTYKINVTNYAQGSITLNFTAMCPAGWTCDVPPSSTIPKGNKLVSMVVTPSSDAKIGSYNISVNITGDYWPRTFVASATHKIGLHLKPVVEISPSSNTGHPRDTLTYKVIVKNKDDSTYGASEFHITAKPPTSWSAALNDEYVTVDGESSGNTTLAVTSDRFADEASYIISVSATFANLTGVGAAEYKIILCGNGVCDTEHGETPATCSQDCWEPGYSQFKCPYKNSRNLSECDRNTTKGAEFSADVNMLGEKPSFIVCSRFATKEDCKNDYKNNNCGIDKACICGSSSKKCSIECSDNSGEYYLMYSVPKLEGNVASDVSIISPNYTYSCPYFGIPELRGIKDNLSSMQTDYESLSDNFRNDWPECSNAYGLAAKKISDYLSSLNSMLNNPTLESAALAKADHARLLPAIEKIIYIGCLSANCAGSVQCTKDSDCNDNNTATIDICNYARLSSGGGSCSCEHVTQCPYACNATFEEFKPTPEGCFKEFSYGKVGCGDQFCVNRIEVACPNNAAEPGATISARCTSTGNSTYNVEMNVAWQGGDHAKANIFGQESNAYQESSFTYSQQTDSPGTTTTRVVVFDAEENVKYTGEKNVTCMAQATCRDNFEVNPETGECRPCSSTESYDPATKRCVPKTAQEIGWLFYAVLIVAIPIILIIAFYFRDDVEEQLSRLKIWLQYRFG